MRPKIPNYIMFYLKIDTKGKTQWEIKYANTQSEMEMTNEIMAQSGWEPHSGFKYDFGYRVYREML